MTLKDNHWLTNAENVIPLTMTKNSTWRVSDSSSPVSKIEVLGRDLVWKTCWNWCPNSTFSAYIAGDQSNSQQASSYNVLDTGVSYVTMVSSSWIQNKFKINIPASHQVYISYRLRGETSGTGQFGVGLTGLNGNRIVNLEQTSTSTDWKYYSDIITTPNEVGGVSVYNQSGPKVDIADIVICPIGTGEDLTLPGVDFKKTTGNVSATSSWD